MENHLYEITSVIVLGWLGWLSLTTIQHGKKIAILQSIQEKVNGIDEKQDKLSDRLDIFLKSELDTLKEIAKRE